MDSSFSYPTLAQKKEALFKLLASFKEVFVALSGGVDSTFLLAMRLKAHREGTRACLAFSPSLPQSDQLLALSFCKEWSVPLFQLKTGEMESRAYRRNDEKRCYYCKESLFETLEKLQKCLSPGVLLYGANASDAEDYRPGFQSALNHQVRAPLLEAGLTKLEIRMLAKEENLKFWDKPASPCLSSRIAYGEEVTEEKLRKVELAESFLKALGFGELRVRLYPKARAKIEIREEDWGRLASPLARRRIDRALKKCGFKEVLLDLEPFYSGKLNGDLGKPKRGS